MRAVIPATPIEDRVKLELDNGFLIIQRSPSKRYTFPDRRAAVTWPSPHNDGYFAIYGMFEELFDPWVLLAERTFAQLDKMLEALFAQAVKYGCTDIYADLSDDWAVVNKKLRAAYRKMRPGSPQIYDSSEWSDIERSIPILSEKNEKEALILPEGTQVFREFSSLRPDSLVVTDRIQPWQRFPAYNALAQCAISWELFPYKKAARQEAARPVNGY
jgi:hypothetical protein